MIKKLVTLLLIILVSVALMGVSILDRKVANQPPVDGKLIPGDAVLTELLPTPTPVILEAATPTERVLPRVGANASLVLGASLLVLIIIGGVIFTSRKKLKH